MLSSLSLTLDSARERLRQQLTDVRAIATDIDGTLTQEGKFTTELLQAIDRLNTKGIELLLVTGRSAGWVSAIAHYLPVAGAIAENGGVYFDRDGGFDFITQIDSIDAHRAALAERFWELQADYPQIEESSDNQFRDYRLDI